MYAKLTGTAETTQQNEKVWQGQSLDNTNAKFGTKPYKKMPFPYWNCRFDAKPYKTCGPRKKHRVDTKTLKTQVIL